MSLFAIVSSLIVSVLPEVTCKLTLIEFEQIQPHSTIPGAIPISTHSAVSLIHCATFCGQDNRCRSFTVNKDALSLGVSEVECNVLDSFVSTTADLVNSHLHYVQVVQPVLGIGIGIAVVAPITTTTSPAAPPTTTTSPAAPPTTTTFTGAPPALTSASSAMSPITTTTTSFLQPTSSPLIGSTIVDILHGVMNSCGTSTYNILVLTASGTVYHYEDIDAMTTTGACATDDFLSLFSDYDTMPAPSDVTGLLLHQSDIVEMYTSSHVRRWNSRSDGTLLKNSYSTKAISSYLGTSAWHAIAAQSNPMLWTAYRSRSSVERHFYFGLDSFVMVSSQWGHRSFMRTEDVHDQNGFNMNPWSHIPTTTIAVTKTKNDNTEYLLVDNLGVVYIYTITHSPDNNNPTKSLSVQGNIVF